MWEARVNLAAYKILVVEDEPIIAELLADMLMELGCATVWATDTVAEALGFLAQHSPDLAVLDVHLHGDVSYAIADRLKQTGIPYIFSSGHPASELGDVVGSDICISMPYTIDVLESALTAALQDRAETKPA
jgi:CheY-like chemotaxis protein